MNDPCKICPRMCRLVKNGKKRCLDFQVFANARLRSENREMRKAMRKFCSNYCHHGITWCDKNNSTCVLLNYVKGRK